MAIKRDVHEICQKCGKKDAELRGGYVVWGMHKCQHAASGPSTPPRQSSVNDANFVPYALDIPDFLRNQRNLAAERSRAAEIIRGAAAGFCGGNAEIVMNSVAKTILNGELIKAQGE